MTKKKKKIGILHYEKNAHYVNLRKANKIKLFKMIRITKLKKPAKNIQYLIEEN